MVLSLEKHVAFTVHEFGKSGVICDDDQDLNSQIWSVICVHINSKNNADIWSVA